MLLSTACLERNPRACIRHLYRRKRLPQRPITAVKYLRTSLLSSVFQTKCCSTPSITHKQWKRRAVKLICLMAIVNPCLVAIHLLQPLSLALCRVKSYSKILMAQSKQVDPIWLETFNNLQSIPKVWWLLTTTLFQFKQPRQSLPKWLNKASLTNNLNLSLLIIHSLLRNPPMTISWFM